MMKKAGLDRAYNLFQNGNWTEFFGLNAKTASFVGAGLQAIALLKSCFETVEAEQDLAKLERDLEREKDLLNIKLTFDFDIGIANNIAVCKKAASMFKITGMKEFLCRLAEKAGIGKLFDALEQACTIPDMDEVLADIGFGGEDAIGDMGR